jgi:host factor-I protein
MDAVKHEAKQPIEPQFLSQAFTRGVRIKVGQMNRTEFEGVIRDVGRYEINLEANGSVIILLKQEISFLSTPQHLLDHEQQTDALAAAPTAASSPSATPMVKPNIQEEFLDKAIREKHLLTVYLINGQRIKAHIEGYDNFTILLAEGNRQHLYYKHSITTINR